MNTAAARLDALRLQRPEWEPWLAVVEVAVRESAERAWNETVPDTRSGGGAAPRLTGATLSLPRIAVQSYVKRLLHAASRSGTPEMATLGAATARDLDAIALFRAALCHEPNEIAAAATDCGAHPDAFQAVAALIPVPFLQACNRSWGSMRNWVEPYCHVCGAWPAFAEVRGIERSRYYRCGRCGGEWHAHALSCPFCATTDHRDLVRLVPGDSATSSAVEACRKCLGYLKTFNRLQGCAAQDVLLEDLGGVALDLAALQQGYCRPATAGYALEITITEPIARRRFLAWNA